MSNPILNNNFVENEQVINGIPMTVNGTLGKTFILFAVLMASAVLVWHTFILGQLDKAQMLTSGGAIIGFVLAFGWFPVTEIKAWIMFILCFIVSCVISTFVSVVSEKQENKKLEEALKRFKEGQ